LYVSSLYFLLNPLKIKKINQIITLNIKRALNLNIQTNNEKFRYALNFLSFENIGIKSLLKNYIKLKNQQLPIPESVRTEYEYQIK